MNPTAFSELLTDISDEYIVSAAKPRSKPVHWYQISAAAAAIVLLIAAVVYPKLRIQTPEIAELSESSAASAEVITAATAPPDLSGYAETQTVTSPMQTTESSVTVPVPASTNVPVSAVVTEADTPIQTNTITEAAPIRTDAAVSTEPPKTELTATATVVPVDSPVTTEPQTAAIRVPLWKGIPMHQDDYPEEPKPMISGKITVCPPVSDDDQCEYYRKAYGIPKEYDLTQHQCLLIVLDTFMYQDAAVIGGTLTDNGLQLKIACLKKKNMENSTFHFALPIPDDLVMEPENCTAEYLILTDETKYQALLTDSLTIEIREQEGLQ